MELEIKMAKIQKLELTWVGKEQVTRLEPRILIEDAEHSYHAKARHAANDLFNNKIIYGDNLLALKALEVEYYKGVQLVYIDPPYNTGNAFDHYDDGVEHSLWLTLMRDRIVLLKKLLKDDGVFCCQIDDNEAAYLKVMLDEIFGRKNYLTSFYVQVRYDNKTLAEDSDYHKVIEQVFVYAKDSAKVKVIKQSEQYSVDKFEWDIQVTGEGQILELGGKKVEIFKLGTYDIKKVAPSITGLKETWATGSLLKQKGSSGEFLGKYLAPRKDEDGLGCLYKVYGIGEDGIGHRFFTGPKKATATKGKFYSGVPLNRVEELNSGESKKHKPIVNFYDFAASFGNCRQEGSVDFRGGKKPEALLKMIIEYFTEEGDLVLDSFAGSGSTAATAHKLHRQWITVELGEHCFTHVIPRLQRVIDNQDSAGITNEVDWSGGGGFRFYKLAPSLLEKDKWGNWVINKEYDANMLAAAVCKHEGFTYSPSDTDWWAHGYSTETDFIYVTTQTLTEDQLVALSEEVGNDRTLLVCCAAYKASSAMLNDKLVNLTVKKMPNALLSKCEWGKDDYSLNITNLPVAEDEDEPAPAAKKKAASKEADLFSDAE